MFHTSPFYRATFSEIPVGESFCDPLDLTKIFIKADDNVAVNIANAEKVNFSAKHEVFGYLS